MTPTRVRTLLLLAAVAFMLVTVLLQVRLAGGGSTAAPPVLTVVVTALMALGTVAVAWPIRRWNSGSRDRAINPLRAARTVALAKAAAMAGAVLTGGWSAFLVLALPLMAVEAQAERALLSGLAVLTSLGLTVAGLVAERWCMIPPEDDDPTRGPGEASPA